jgi:hypothetical protein
MLSLTPSPHPPPPLPVARSPGASGVANGGPTKGRLSPVQGRSGKGRGPGLESEGVSKGTSKGISKDTSKGATKGTSKSKPAKQQSPAQAQGSLTKAQGKGALPRGVVSSASARVGAELAGAHEKEGLEVSVSMSVPSAEGRMEFSSGAVFGSGAFETHSFPLRLLHCLALVQASRAQLHASAPNPRRDPSLPLQDGELYALLQRKEYARVLSGRAMCITIRFADLFQARDAEAFQRQFEIMRLLSVRHDEMFAEWRWADCVDLCCGLTPRTYEEGEVLTTQVPPPSAACPPLSVLCPLVSTPSPLPSAVCCLLSALCCGLSALCPLLSAVCSALCCLPSALCCLILAVSYLSAADCLLSTVVWAYPTDLRPGRGMLTTPNSHHTVCPCPLRAVT